jgi:malonate transporter and related proteins
MFSTVAIVLPIFALILAGYLSRKLKILGPNAATELNRFVIYLALPALLFDIMARVSWTQLDQPGFIAAFGLGAGIVFVLTVVWRARNLRHVADASIDGIATAYANTGYIGFPLCLLVFGRSSLAAVTIASIITVCVLFAVAIVVIEISLQTERHSARLVRKVGGSLLRNPLLIAPVLGALYSAAGLHLAGSVETFFTLLGGAASPCALVGLGLFLAQKRTAAAGHGSMPVWLALTKLVVQPALTWFFAYRVFSVPTPLAQIAVLVAALPTGTGPFMLAEFYQREGALTSKTILFSTLGSLLTLPALLLWMK